MTEYGYIRKLLEKSICELTKEELQQISDYFKKEAERKENTSRVRIVDKSLLEQEETEEISRKTR